MRTCKGETSLQIQEKYLPGILPGIYNFQTYINRVYFPDFEYVFLSYFPLQHNNTKHHK